MGRRSRKRETRPTATASSAPAASAGRSAPAAPPTPAAQSAKAPPPAPRAEATKPRPAERPARTSRRDQAPLPPWGRFPLVELCVLSAIVLAVVGVIVGGRPGGVLIAGAVALGAVAGLEVAIREHLGGYRSHTLLLSATLAVAVMAVLFFTHVPRSAMVPIAAGVLAAAFIALRALFKKRSGGFGVKVR
jgi:hypothetical protein